MSKRKDIAVISRQVYTQRVAIPAGTDRIALKSLPISIEIPRATKDIAGANFEVLVKAVEGLNQSVNKLTE